MKPRPLVAGREFLDVGEDSTADTRTVVTRGGHEFLGGNDRDLLCASIIHRKTVEFLAHTTQSNCRWGWSAQFPRHGRCGSRTNRNRCGVGPFDWRRFSAARRPERQTRQWTHSRASLVELPSLASTRSATAKPVRPIGRIRVFLAWHVWCFQEMPLTHLITPQNKYSLRWIAWDSLKGGTVIRSKRSFGSYSKTTCCVKKTPNPTQIAHPAGCPRCLSVYRPKTPGFRPFFQPEAT